MALVLTNGPASEPVSVAEAKAHLRLDGSGEDVLVASLILTSRLHIEAALGLALITQAWRLQLDRWPRGPALAMPLRPLQSVTAVRVLAEDGAATLIPASDYLVDSASAPPRLLSRARVWPRPGRTAAGIEIDFVAGYGDAAADVPAPIRQALLLLVAHWYEHREPIAIGAPQTAVPLTVSELLEPYRVKRL